MFDGFVNPGLVAGAALCVVPLLIHLLNRQRHKPMAWAAMRFVLAAYRKTRRRARLENLLLLLLRMAAVALLAFCVARPFTGPRSPLAGLTENRRDVVLVLDGSASTGYRREVRTVFEDVVDRARELLLELRADRGDRVRLILAGSYPRLLSWRTPDEALSLLGTLVEPTDESLDLAAAFGEVARLAEEDAGDAGRTSLEIRLLCDLQRRSFEPPLTAGARADSAPLFVEQLERLSALGAKVLVEDLGPGEVTPPNLSVDRVSTDAPYLGVGLPVEFEVRVQNWGPNLQGGVRVTLEVDGERRPSRLVDVPARGFADATFPVVFQGGGPHVLTAGIDADRLAVDDHRTAVVEVPPPAGVLLVDGQPQFEIDRDEVGYLAAVLEPPAGDDVPGGPESGAPFRVRVVERHELDEDFDLTPYDVIVLANVGTLAQPLVERLEQRVAAGASLVITVGDQVVPEAYNQRLFAADGSGLLPAELGPRVAVRDRRAGYFRIAEFATEHPAFRFFRDERWRPLLTEVPIYEFLSARLLEADDAPAPADATATDRPGPARAGVAHVLARLDDEASSPLLIERSYDRGKVFLWLTTIDPDWTRLPESPRTLVPLVHEWLRYAATPEELPRNLAVGDPFAAVVSSFPRSLTVVRPDGARRPLEGEPEPLGPGSWRLPAFEDTDRVGTYAIEVEGRPSIPFAVAIDPREGDLDRLNAVEVEALHPALAMVGAGADADADRSEEAPQRGEIWRALALACLLALIAESLWAAWIGHRRRLP